MKVVETPKKLVFAEKVRDENGNVCICPDGGPMFIAKEFLPTGGYLLFVDSTNDFGVRGKSLIYNRVSRSVGTITTMYCKFVKRISTVNKYAGFHGVEFRTEEGK